MPASDQCSRIDLDEAGIAKGWTVERLPEIRTMGEAVLLLDGRVVIVNGARTGVAGYSSVFDLVGNSNADHVSFFFFFLAEQHAVLTVVDLANIPSCGLRSTSTC
jgi:hypothetical protein